MFCQPVDIVYTKASSHDYIPCRVPVQVPPRAHFRLWAGCGAVQGELRPDVGQGDAADGGLARGPAAVGHAPPQAHPKVRLQGMYRDLTLHCILLNQCGYPISSLASTHLGLSLERGAGLSNKHTFQRWHSPTSSNRFQFRRRSYVSRNLALA